MARLSLSKPCTLLPLRRAVTRSPREAARYSSADQADMPPQETSGAGSGRSDRIKGLNILGVYLFRKIQSPQIDGVFRMLWRAESSKYLFRQASLFVNPNLAVVMPRFYAGHPVIPPRQIEAQRCKTGHSVVLDRPHYADHDDRAGGDDDCCRGGFKPPRRIWIWPYQDAGQDRL